MRSYGQYCAAARALDTVGDRWSLLIVRELLLRGPCRYTDLREGLPGIATNLLADRLRELERSDIVTREQAPPPVARTLFRLTKRGEQLAPIVRELVRWGVPLMTEPVGEDAFRSRWLELPVELFLTDRAPERAPTVIELRTGEVPMTVRAGGGEVRTSLGSAEDPDLVLSGNPQLILGVLSGRLELADASARGLECEGDTAALERVRPVPA
jgi:DNA-binding HxlR family transcriptional regulator